MKRFAKIGSIGLAIIVLMIAGLAYRELSHPSLAPYASLTLKTSAAKANGLTARFLGVATLVLDDGETAIMTDGFFSRPGLLQTFTGTIAPNQARIDDALNRAKVSKLAAILVAHSHHDHAMDSASVAKRTGALLIGSKSTANIGRGEMFPENRIRVVNGGEIFNFGRFKVTVFKSPHSPDALFTGEIETLLQPPVKASAYKEGGNYSFLIEHDGVTILVHASANFTPGIYKNVRADVIFFGIGVLGKQTEQFAEDYWREVVKATGAKLVIPIHWDDFTVPLDQPLLPMPLLMDNFDRGIGMVRRMAERDDVSVKFMPVFEPVDVTVAAAN